MVPQPEFFKHLDKEPASILLIATVILDISTWESCINEVANCGSEVLNPTYLFFFFLKNAFKVEMRQIVIKGTLRRAL